MFFSAATAAGAFGGLLARLINFMDGVGGYEGWVSVSLLTQTPKSVKPDGALLADLAVFALS